MGDSLEDNTKTEGASENDSTNSTDVWKAFLAENGNSHKTVFDTTQRKVPYDKIPNDVEMARNLEEVAADQLPLYPLVFLYDFGQDKKGLGMEYPKRKELIENASVEIAEISKVYLKDGKIDPHSMELLTLAGGWLELLKRAYEITGKKGFGENIRQYMLFRASDSMCSDGNSDLPESLRQKMKESYRKTAEMLNRRIPYNN
jgi:hypothetical protein